MAPNRNPFGFLRFLHPCNCDDIGCKNERMLHEFGDLSFPLPRATNMDNEDEMKENKDLVLYMLKKARVEAAIRKKVLFARL